MRRPALAALRRTACDGAMTLRMIASATSQRGGSARAARRARYAADLSLPLHPGCLSVMPNTSPVTRHQTIPSFRKCESPAAGVAGGDWGREADRQDLFMEPTTPSSSAPNRRTSTA